MALSWRKLLPGNIIFEEGSEILIRNVGNFLAMLATATSL